MIVTSRNTFTSRRDNPPFSEDNWIQFDIEKLHQLNKTCEEVMKFIVAELPSVNWNSPSAIVDYFGSVLDISIPNAKIKTITSLLDIYDEHSYEFEVILGVAFYLKLKYLVKNYIGCILRHETNGIVKLRWYEGEWRMPNRQPLPTAPELTECIIARYQKEYKP